MNFNNANLAQMLSCSDPEEINELYKRAYALKLRVIGPLVSLRGLIEFSNFCQKNCFYCGLRAGNTSVQRFRLAKSEILASARFAVKNRFSSIVLQSGEQETPQFADFIEELLTEITPMRPGGVGITLSCGEQTETVYKRWHNAGARRYLLRIESSNEKLYHRLHPSSHSFARRIECLKNLKLIGFQLGTGTMIGLPGQTIENLVEDLRFFAEIDADMLGMGPYIPHPDTPLGAKQPPITEEYKSKQLELGLKMISCARLMLEDVNIASTTALQALSATGYQQGLKAGANVLMPNLTDVSYRQSYQLYEGKPTINEGAEASLNNLRNTAAAINETILFDEFGDSKHFSQR